MPRPYRQWRACAVLVALALLSACGPSPETEPEAPAVVEFARGNSVDPESLDPLQARSEPTLNILRDLHEGLTTLDARGQVIPGAARKQGGIRTWLALRWVWWRRGASSD